jgi:hypothetical protein
MIFASLKTYSKKNTYTAIGKFRVQIKIAKIIFQNEGHPDFD